MALARPRVGGERHRLGEVARKLDPPGRDRGFLDRTAIGRDHGRRAAATEARDQHQAARRSRLVGRRGRPDPPRLLGPVLGAAARDGRDIAARFPREPAARREPGFDARRPAIIGRGRKPEIAEAAPQVIQQLGRFRDRLLGIERIGKAALGRGPGHELRGALRPCPAGDAGAETAFLPDQPGEEVDRHAVRRGGALDHAAERLIDRLALLRRRRRHQRQRSQGCNQKTPPRHFSAIRGRHAGRLVGRKAVVKNRPMPQHPTQVLRRRFRSAALEESHETLSSFLRRRRARGAVSRLTRLRAGARLGCCASFRMPT